MIEHYKNSLIGRESFNDWLDYNKKDYITEIEVKGSNE